MQQIAGFLALKQLEETGGVLYVANAMARAWEGHRIVRDLDVADDAPIFLLDTVRTRKGNSLSRSYARQQAFTLHIADDCLDVAILFGEELHWARDELPFLQGALPLIAALIDPWDRPLRQDI